MLAVYLLQRIEITRRLADEADALQVGVKIQSVVSQSKNSAAMVAGNVLQFKPQSATALPP